jgi:tetrapyrrole methylase family protein/MazG family protein
MVADMPKVPMVHPLDALQTMVRRIYGPNGCVWAREQTHYTLWRHVRAEASEVVQVLKDIGPVPLPANFTAETVSTQLAQHLAEELGDLLFQVLVHADLAEREGLFTLADVLDVLQVKLVHRHPHVFGLGMAHTLDEVEKIWTEAKTQERMR